MAYKQLAESPEKTTQRVVNSEPDLSIARSFQRDLHPVHFLQKTIGNQQVVRLIQAKRLQSGLNDTAQMEQDSSQGNDGLPVHLKSGLEALSGTNLSGVRVHYNSSKPAQLNALAYTQGQDIYVGQGQEKHLPHEGWHAVQQAQGRVNPITQIKGVSVNDDENLEQEADVMGGEALQMARTERTQVRSYSASVQKKEGNIAQCVLPAIFSGLGAAEWIALGAAGYVVASDAVNQVSGDVAYSFDEMEGVLLPGGGNDVAAYRTAHPNTTITEATHYAAVWFGTSDSRKMGIKFGINFLYDGYAIGNISLSIVETYDWPGWGGNVNVNITPRSLAAGGVSSVRFTVNMGCNNSWFVPDRTGNVIFLLRADGDLSKTSSSRPWSHIG
ncbi:MAG: DUF4157 domain-containing protein [Desulfobacteraceae bacterium]|jgi:hypothetical protein